MLFLVNAYVCRELFGLEYQLFRESGEAAYIGISRYILGLDPGAADLLVSDDCPPESAEEVTLTDFDPDGEIKIVAAALYAASALPDSQLMAIARGLSPADRVEVLKACVGERTNRRHRPGRAFERTSYRFDVLTDYGAFRDLQRHRLLTIEWQPLSPRHGFVEPDAIGAAGVGDDWARVMDASADLHDHGRSRDLGQGLAGKPRGGHARGDKDDGIAGQWAALFRKNCDDSPRDSRPPALRAIGDRLGGGTISLRRRTLQPGGPGASAHGQPILRPLECRAVAGAAGPNANPASRVLRSQP